MCEDKDSGVEIGKIAENYLRQDKKLCELVSRFIELYKTNDHKMIDDHFEDYGCISEVEDYIILCRYECESLESSSNTILLREYGVESSLPDNAWITQWVTCGSRYYIGHDSRGSSECIRAARCFHSANKLPCLYTMPSVVNPKMAREYTWITHRDDKLFENEICRHVSIKINHLEDVLKKL